MRELINDPLYEILEEYDRLEVDYCLMENNSQSQGVAAHKEAVVFTMRRVRELFPWTSIDESKMTAQEISPDKLLNFPDEPWKKTSHGTTRYHAEYAEGTTIPYWYAFVEPPHGTGPVVRDGRTIRSEYGKEDFDAVNEALFPKGADELEVYEWSTDWSSYFDAGREWWGTLCCSIYDRRMNRYAVLMASSTD